MSLRIETVGQASRLRPIGILVAAFAASAALAQPVVRASTYADSIDPAVVDSIAAKLRVDICALPKTASAEDIEAALTFALSQSGAPKPVLLAALRKAGLNGCGLANFDRALGNVETAMLRRKTGIGTAALTGGAFSGNGVSNFTGPAIAIGGGATYTQ